MIKAFETIVFPTVKCSPILLLYAGFCAHLPPYPSLQSQTVGAGIIDRSVKAELPGTLSLFHQEKIEGEAEEV